MNTNTIKAGFIATVAMTVLMMVAPIMGMPKMDIGAMLGGMMGASSTIGWIMHFVIGIVFAIGYVLLLNNKLPIRGNVTRGAVYGVIVFVFAQIMMMVMAKMEFMPAPPSEGMLVMMFGSLMGHLVYGGVLGFFIKKDVVDS